MFRFNAQHDCRRAKCSDTGKRKQMQERQESSIEESFIEHKDDNRYIINLAALHNAHLIRYSLPRDLTKPIPLHPNREAQHHQYARELRVVKDAKRAEQEKLKAAKAAKKAAEGASEVGLEPSLEHSGKSKAKKRKRTENDN